MLSTAKPFEADKVNYSISALHLAVITAYTNIQNCLKRGNFTDTSFTNFKNTKKQEYKLIVSTLPQEPLNSSEWITVLHELTIKIDADTVTAIHDMTTDKLEEKAVHNDDMLNKSKGANHSTGTPRPKSPNVKPGSLESPKSQITHSGNQDDAESDSEYTSAAESGDEESVHKTQADHIMQELICGLKSFAESNRTNKRLRIETLKNSTQDVQEWFGKFERQTVLWQEQEKGHEIPSWLEDNALRYWELIPNEEKYNYSKIKETLLNKFRTTDSSFQAKTNFYSIRQEPQESIDEFTYRLFKCKRDWPLSEHRLFDQDVAQIFKKGLHPEISKQLVAVLTNDVHEIIQKAKEVETIITLENQNKTIVSAPIHNVSDVLDQKQIKCYNCQKDGHLARNCTYRRKPSPSEHNYKIFCLFCGKANHLALNCRLMQSTIHNKPNNKPNTNNTKDHATSRKYCFACKTKTHNTKDCRSRSKDAKCFKCNQTGHFAKQCKNILNH